MPAPIVPSPSTATRPGAGAYSSATTVIMAASRPVPRKGPSAHGRTDQDDLAQRRKHPRLLLPDTGRATNRPPGQVCAMTVYVRTGAGRYQAYPLEGGVTAAIR